MPDDSWAAGLGWSNFEAGLFEDIAIHNQAVFNDGLLMEAFNVGWFNMDVDSQYRADAREFVIEYLDDVYGIDFDAAFDWDAWREAYG